MSAHPDHAPPAIDDHAWGSVEVAGTTFKDVKLWPGGCRSWDWRETGTDHAGGIQPADVAELLDHGAQHVVLSLGRRRRLTVHADTRALLDDRGVPYDELSTGDAIARYEQLRRDGTRVGLLLHTTC